MTFNKHIASYLFSFISIIFSIFIIILYISHASFANVILAREVAESNKELDSNIANETQDYIYPKPYAHLYVLHPRLCVHQICVLSLESCPMICVPHSNPCLDQMYVPCSTAMSSGILQLSLVPSKNISTPSTDLAYYRTLYERDISQWEPPFIDEGVAYEEMAPLPKIAPLVKTTSLSEITHLQDSKNPHQKTTQSENLDSKILNDRNLSHIIALGKTLFHERMLSKSGQISCANCHNAELAFGDGVSRSFGHNRIRGTRNAPNVMMSGFFERLFWDGRATSLEEQILFPITNHAEMANDVDTMIETLKGMPEYYVLFARAFADDSNKNSKKSDVKNLINIENIAIAIATYERSLVPQNTRFNQFLKGKYSALSDKEIYGLHIFRTKGRCMNCHYGVALTDGQFHNIGLSFYGRELQDLGRYVESGEAKDIGAFKTPSLIRISKSAPYMHNGIFPSLSGVLNMYNAGFPTKDTKNRDSTVSADSNNSKGLGDFRGELEKEDSQNYKDTNNAKDLTPKTSTLIKPLHLSKEELEALEAFLMTL